MKDCKHREKKLVILRNVAHPLDDFVYVNEVCKKCGASRIAEYDKDLDGSPFNTVAALAWRGA